MATRESRIGVTRSTAVGSTFVLDLAEEVHGQMECLRTRPANVCNTLAKLVVQPLRSPRVPARPGEPRGSTSPSG